MTLSSCVTLLRTLTPTLVGLLTIAVPCAARAEPPPDKPVALYEEQQRAAFESAIKPLVAEARRTYPAAKQRFVDGLKPGHTFFVVTRIYDSTGRFEQLFVKANRATPDGIDGVVASDVAAVTFYRPGDRILVQDAAVMDWLIQAPDGSEEGNIVGKFLDTYEPHS